MRLTATKQQPHLSMATGMKKEKLKGKVYRCALPAHAKQMHSRII